MNHFHLKEPFGAKEPFYVKEPSKGSLTSHQSEKVP